MEAELEAVAHCTAFVFAAAALKVMVGELEDLMIATEMNQQGKMFDFE